MIKNEMIGDTTTDGGNPSADRGPRTVRECMKHLVQILQTAQKMVDDIVSRGIKGAAVMSTPEGCPADAIESLRLIFAARDEVTNLVQHWVDLNSRGLRAWYALSQNLHVYDPLLVSAPLARAHQELLKLNPEGVIGLLIIHLGWRLRDVKAELEVAYNEAVHRHHMAQRQ